MTTYHKPSELLAEMHSHGIYGVSILGDCAFSTEGVPTFSAAETQSRIVERGLGGEVTPTTDQLIYGWTTASALAKRYVGGYPGENQLSGRGSIFRACAKALTEEGF